MATITSIKGVTNLSTREGLVIIHLMTALMPPDSRLNDYIDELIDNGFNVIQSYADLPDMPNCIKIMDACIGKPIKVMPGAYGTLSPNDFNPMLTATWDHPALLRWGKENKRVYSGWFYQGDKDNGFQSLPDGITKGDFLYWLTSQYPAYNSDTGEWTDYLYSYLASPAALTRMLNVTGKTSMDGLINFAAGKDGGFGRNLYENSLFGAIPNRLGKMAAAGIVGAYCSVGVICVGFEGLHQQAMEIMDNETEDTAQAIILITANDLVEMSNAGPALLITENDNGIIYDPPASYPWRHGYALPYPATEKSGIMKYLKPFFLAFRKKHKYQDIVIEEEALFSWHTLHPRNAPFQPEMPEQLRAICPTMVNNMPIDDWWKLQVAHGEEGRTEQENSGQVKERSEKIKGIKYAMPPEYDYIKVAGHFKNPGKLAIRINGVMHISEPIDVKFGFYSIEQEIGLPEFFILNLDNSVRHHSIGRLPITNECWIGQWDSMIRHQPFI